MRTFFLVIAFIIIAIMSGLITSMFVLLEPPLIPPSKSNCADTVWVYFTDEQEKPDTVSYGTAYEHLTNGTDVRFYEIKNPDKKEYSVSWALWHNGNILASNPDIYTKVPADQLQKYKAKIRHEQNKRMERYKAIWPD